MKIDFERAAAEIGIDVCIYKKLCATFLRATTEDVERMCRYYEAGETEKIKETAHHIKGSALNMEFYTLSGIAESIHQGVEENVGTSTKELIGKLKAEFSRVKRSIEAQL